ncbi:hypothetical protein ASG40_19395 [Methylobacterium sp. Leaf399]|uniref:hypothetical protein n=1 Tax=Methylobacterium sp. Leaf399 TaxID=1736364 RepID=UPI0006F4BF32|nr:hypothetical protein [Methylobacterium sp. Leaf399]KQT13993.1 hypothetical protein ASG40_19395 [Methylobacterium sp. Leaf399]
MKTVTILSDFSGYPNGKDERVFAKGDEPELSNEYADLLVSKGLAREVATPKSPAKAEPATPAQKDADA